MKRFKAGDLVVINETGEVGFIDEVSGWFCDYAIELDNFIHEYDDHEVRLPTKLHKLLYGIDNEV